MKHWILWVNIIGLIVTLLYVDNRHSYKEGLEFGYNRGYEEGFSESENHYAELLEQKYDEYSSLYTKYEEEHLKVEALEDTCYDSRVIDFYSEYAVIVLNDNELHSYYYGSSDSEEVHIAEEPNPKTYHTYDVMEYNEKDITNYTVMSKKEAESKGYTPCRLCFDN